MSDNPGKTVTLYQFSELSAAAWKKACMTPQNITSSFRATGVFPVNRQALEILQIKEKSLAKLSMAAIAKTNGINFLPLYSPKRSLISIDAAVEFTDEEMKHFKRRLKDMMYVPGDTRYIQWLKIHHSECNTLVSQLQGIMIQILSL